MSRRLCPTRISPADDVLKPYSPPPGLAEAKPDAGGFLSLSRKGIDAGLVPDVPAAERAIVYATQVRGIRHAAATGVAPAWTTKPSWFIAVNEPMLSPEYEQANRKHIHATMTTLPTACPIVVEAEGSSRGDLSTPLTK